MTPGDILVLALLLLAASVLGAPLLVRFKGGKR